LQKARPLLHHIQKTKKAIQTSERATASEAPIRTPLCSPLSDGVGGEDFGDEGEVVGGGGKDFGDEEGDLVGGELVGDGAGDEVGGKGGDVVVGDGAGDEVGGEGGDVVVGDGDGDGE